jgi:hypothetical protein
MSQKKRTNEEITNFLSQFVSWISSKLSHIQIVKLSSDHIAETEAEIKRIKQLIKETKILIKKQESVVKALGQIKIKSRSASLMPVGSDPLKINTDIEIFSPEEIDEDSE